MTDALLAFPIAYYMARMASPRVRGMLVIAVLLPLWAAYLVKVYAWRTIPPGQRLSRMGAHPVRYRGAGPRRSPNAWLVLSYLWLPYMINRRSAPAWNGSRHPSWRPPPTSEDGRG